MTAIKPMQAPSTISVDVTNPLEEELPATRCVLMAVYNGDSATYLDEALRSVLVPEIHRVLVGIDGPICDELSAVLYRVAGSDSRIEVVSFLESRGLAFILNDLIDIAIADPRCDLLFRMDADDISEPFRFQSQITFLKEHPEVDVLGGGADLIDAHGFIFGRLRKATVDAVLKRRVSYDSPFVHPTVVIRSALLRQGHRYPTKTIRFEDVALWAELALGGAQFANLPISVLRYRLTEDSTLRRIGWRKVLDETRIRLRYAFLTSPWRIDLIALVILIAFAKWLMPTSALTKLQVMRTRAQTGPLVEK